jgi:hypothetical protein
MKPPPGAPAPSLRAPTSKPELGKSHDSYKWFYRSGPSHATSLRKVTTL